jgi:hypothetical protein
MLLIVDPVAGSIRGQGLSTEPPPTEQLWDKLAHAMEQPLAGDRHRPAQLQVGTDPRWMALSADLLDIGVTCVPREKLQGLTVAFDHLAAIARG